MKLVAAAAIAAALSFAPAFATEELDRLFADYWTNELEENPLSATYSGVEGYNDKMPAAGPADQARRLDEAKAFLARLDAADLNGASDDDKLNASLLRFILRHSIAIGAFDGWRVPFVSDSGFHNEFGFVVDATPFRNEADYRAYLARLEALPAYLDQNVDNMWQG